MTEELLVRHCAPTLAGIKTGSMFTCPAAGQTQLKTTLRQWNHRLGKKGLRVVPLRFGGGRALIYVYRPALLQRDLQHATAQSLLAARGYACTREHRCVIHLMHRLAQNPQDFPHEIGLFLGYPPDDVRGFIEQGAHCSKCTGCWKVYTDVPAAQKIFAKYKKCTQIYCALHQNGRALEGLTPKAFCSAGVKS